MELTRKAIIDWLKTLPPDRELGESARNYACGCPVACYLREVGGYSYAAVYGSAGAEVQKEPDSPYEDIALPTDVGTVVEDFDTLPGFTQTVEEFLDEIGNR